TEYDVSGSKITMNGQDASILNGIVCIPGIGGELSLYLSNGGNMDGKWFTITVGSKTTNLNIKEISVNGAKVLVMEDRVATVFSGNAAMPAGNYIYIRQREIYRSTLLTYKFVSMYVPGTDLMLDKSFEEIGGANAGPDKYTPTTFTYS
ncbi:MAG: hypothetical protein WCK29_02460, partial [archaeon]